jgi:pSer/pThr/pTyr-binding forkhead associated (FHA) protein
MMRLPKTCPAALDEDARRSAYERQHSGISNPEGSIAVDTGNQAADPYLFYRDQAGRQQVTVLESTVGRQTIGRGEGCDLSFYWDHEVSRLHAQLERIGSDWVLIDDGLSRNGTYVNGERLQGRHRLRDGDVILTGATTISFRANRLPPSPETKVAKNVVTIYSLSPTQRQVITALCRPYISGTPYATPATNQQIAAEIYLSIDSVKNHLRTLFGKFGVEDLPQNQKRARLVELAFRSGLVSERKE